VRYTIKWSSIYASPGCKAFYCNLTAAPRIKVHVHQTRERGHIPEWDKKSLYTTSIRNSSATELSVSLQTRRLHPCLKAGGGPFSKFLFIYRTVWKYSRCTAHSEQFGHLTYKTVNQFNVYGSVHRKYTYSNIYPKRCNFTQFIYIWKLLYVFRVVRPSIIRSANNCIYSIWYLFTPLLPPAAIAAINLLVLVRHTGQHSEWMCTDSKTVKDSIFLDLTTIEERTTKLLRSSYENNQQLLERELGEWLMWWTKGKVSGL